MPQLKVGVHCYGLSAHTTAVLNPLVACAKDTLKITAYPLVAGLADQQPTSALHFEYRDPTCKRRYFTIPGGGRQSPQEVTLAAAGIRTAHALANESDVVCLLGIQGLSGLTATLMARFRRKPLVVIHQAAPASAELRRHWVIRFAKSWVLRQAKVVIAETPGTMETLKSVYHLSPNSTILGAYDGGAGLFAPILEKQRFRSRSQLRSEFCLDASAYVLLFVGTVVGYKGLDVLIRALKEVRLADSNAILLVAGHDGQGTLASIQHLVRQEHLSEAVRYLGVLDRDRLAQYYLAADVFVLPTRRDAGPKVLYEAALAGLPIITTAACGGADFLTPEKNCLIVPVNDTGALASAIIQLSDQRRREQMGISVSASIQKRMAEYRNSADILFGAISQAVQRIPKRALVGIPGP